MPKKKEVLTISTGQSGSTQMLGTCPHPSLNPQRAPQLMILPHLWMKQQKLREVPQLILGHFTCMRRSPNSGPGSSEPRAKERCKYDAWIC